MPALIQAADTVLEFPMVDQDPLPRWTQGRVTLLGDAAHPMYPRGSNGAGQAILDARALTDALVAHQDPLAALKAYEAMRLPFTAEVVRMNRKNPPDAILREAFERTGDKPFERVEDVISHEELVALVRGLQARGGLRPAINASGRVIGRRSQCAINHFRCWRCLSRSLPSLRSRPAHRNRTRARRSRSSFHSHPAPASTSWRERSGQKMGDDWKTAVLVDNRPGASGNIGTEAVAKSPPDGYTLLMTAATIVQNRSLFKTAPYDPIADFAPVAPLAIGRLALVTHPSLNAKTVKELIALAKAGPGKMNYGSPGNGTPHHLAMELFKSTTGINLVHVPYKGTSGAVRTCWVAKSR